MALIRPPVVVFPRSLSGHGPVPSIGLAYLAATARRCGHRVQVVDGPGEALDAHHEFEAPVGRLTRIGWSPARIVDQIDADTEVIGVTNMFLHEWPQAKEVVERARRRFPEATIVLGGDNASAFWPWIFEQTDAIDHVVLGEGEATFSALLDQRARGRSMAGLPGTVSRGGASSGPPPGPVTRIGTVDDVPRPAWDLFPLDNYWRHADYFGVARGRSLPVLASRGCPYRCTFCSAPQMWTTRYLTRDPDDLADEIAALVRTWGIENVDFADLTAITKRAWTLRFCDALEARDLSITWQLPVGTRAEALDRPVLERLAETGCRNVTYAPESGSARLLEQLRKKVDVDHVLASVRSAHELGLSTHVNVIIGHPAESWADRWQTTRLLGRAALAGCDSAAAIMFCAYPGSEDFERLLEEGLLEVDESFLYLALARGSSRLASHHPRLSGRQLRALQLAMMAWFFGLTLLRRPRRAVERVRALRTGEESTQLDQLLRIKRRGHRAVPAGSATPPTVTGVASTGGLPPGVGP